MKTEQNTVRTIPFEDIGKHVSEVHSGAEQNGASAGQGERAEQAHQRKTNSKQKPKPESALNNIIKASTIMANVYPEPRFAVERIITEGTTILAAPPKYGKSMLCLNIAVAVAEGGKALSSLAVDEGDVLYLALEDGERRIQTRLKKMTNGKISDRLEVATVWPRLNEGGLEAIDLWIDRHPDARLIIIDTLKMFKPLTVGKRSQNTYDEDYEALQPLTRIASQRVALMIVHHSRKAEADDPLAEISGSYGLTGAVDAALVLRRSRGKSDAVLCVMGRDLEEQELALTYDPKLLLWSYIGPAAVVNRSDERQQVIDLLDRAKDLMAIGDIAAQLDKTHNAVKKLLFNMSLAGEVKSFSGKYQLPSFNPPDKPKARTTSNRGNRVTGEASVTAVTGEGNQNGNRKHTSKAKETNDLQEPVTAVTTVTAVPTEELFEDVPVTECEIPPVTAVTNCYGCGEPLYGEECARCAEPTPF